MICCSSGKQDKSMKHQKRDLAHAIVQLADSQQVINGHILGSFSDLDPAELHLFQEVWQILPAKRQRRTVQLLVRMTESQVELDFDAIFRWLLADGDPQIRVSALAGLWESADATLVEPFIQLMLHDPDTRVRAAAASALGRFVYLGDIEELDATPAIRTEEALLLAYNDTAEELLVRRQALESVAFSSDPAVKDLIEAAAKDDDISMRASAIFAMGRNIDEYWHPFVMQALDDLSPAIRVEAAHAAGGLEIKAAAPRLVMLIDDTDREVSEAAIASLGQIGGTLARRALERCMKNPNAALREAADSALQELELVDGLDENLLFAWDEDDLPTISTTGTEFGGDADEDSDNGKD
jgi:HEAT repeat protein